MNYEILIRNFYLKLFKFLSFLSCFTCTALLYLHKIHQLEIEIFWKIRITINCDCHVQFAWIQVRQYSGNYSISLYFMKKFPSLHSAEQEQGFSLTTDLIFLTKTGCGFTCSSEICQRKDNSDFVLASRKAYWKMLPLERFFWKRCQNAYLYVNLHSFVWK